MPKRRKKINMLEDFSDDRDEETETMTIYTIESDSFLREEKVETIEPAAEMITSKSGVRIILQLPGVKRESLKLDFTNGSVKLYALTANRKYVKTVPVTAAADIERRIVSFKNYILEITIPFKPNR
jgi:HSP20 family molecular chaperone IbpA